MMSRKRLQEVPIEVVSPGVRTRAAYSIEAFCEDYGGICKATLYNMWKNGEGPRYMQVRGRRLISVEAAEQWRRDLEEATAK